VAWAEVPEATRAMLAQPGMAVVDPLAKKPTVPPASSGLTVAISVMAWFSVGVAWVLVTVVVVVAGARMADVANE
jgi:hypothetical protein